MSNVKTKLEKALGEMIKEGAKINASAVEKRAGVSNGSVGYYEDIEKKVLAEKVKQQPPKKNKSAGVVTITKAKKESQREKLKEAERLKSKYYQENQKYKVAEKKFGDEIANLIWALHKERSEVSLSHHIVKMARPKKH